VVRPARKRPSAASIRPVTIISIAETLRCGREGQHRLSSSLYRGGRGDLSKRLAPRHQTLRLRAPCANS
jgi:hypothetical protein